MEMMPVKRLVSIKMFSARVEETCWLPLATSTPNRQFLSKPFVETNKHKIGEGGSEIYNRNIGKELRYAQSGEKMTGWSESAQTVPAEPPKYEIMCSDESDSEGESKRKGVKRKMSCSVNARLKKMKCVSQIPQSVRNTDRGNKEPLMPPNTMPELKSKQKEGNQDQSVIISGKENIRKVVTGRNMPKTKVTQKICSMKKDGVDASRIPVKSLKDVKQEDIINKSRLSVSHQLFSDDKEQELIDTLDLTSVESIEPLERAPLVGERKSLKKPKTKSQTNVVKKKIVQVQNNVRPARTRTPPKEFWLVKDSQSARYEKVKVNKKSKVSQPSCSSNQNEEVPSAPSDNNKEPESCAFKSLADLKFVDHLDGFSTSVCWEYPGFKSGLLRLQLNATAKGQTKKSYFGGVVTAGQVLMTAGQSCKELQQGHVLCVPPSTPWAITNTGATEATLYFTSSRT